jgi:hypothetical protein
VLADHDQSHRHFLYLNYSHPSPLRHRNLTVLGRYSFTASVPREGLRPLRDPDAVELDDDDDGGEDV